MKKEGVLTEKSSDHGNVTRVTKMRLGKEIQEERTNLINEFVGVEPSINSHNLKRPFKLSPK